MLKAAAEVATTTEGPQHSRHFIPIADELIVPLLTTWFLLVWC